MVDVEMQNVKFFREHDTFVEHEHAIGDWVADIAVGLRRGGGWLRSALCLLAHAVPPALGSPRRSAYARLHDDDPVANDEEMAAAPCGINLHDPRREQNVFHGPRHHGAHREREVDAGDARGIAHSHHRLTDSVSAARC